MQTRLAVAVAVLLVLCASSVRAEPADSAAAIGAATSSAAPPEGAIVLFDGTDQSEWVSQTYKKWEDSDGPADWKIVDGGALEVVPNAGSLLSRRKFSDFLLHFEFRLPPGDVNGGVFVLARYEFGIKGAADAPEGLACGSFENLSQPLRPRERVLSPPDQWQIVDMKFRAPRLDERGHLLEKARATVHLNGVLIHDDVELGERKGAAKRLGDAAAGPIMLQDHGTAYQFRNIWIVDESTPTRVTPETP